MRVYIVDISGKVERYDLALFSTLKKNNEETFLYCSGHGLFSFLPSKYYMSQHIIKRSIKAFESIINYCYLLIIAIKNPKSIFHFQWLPFLEICEVDIWFLHLIKLFNKSNKIILTIHNIYPHNYKHKSKENYSMRFKKAGKYIDGYIVHTKASKSEVIKEFCIKDELISVCYHGVFDPNVKIKASDRNYKLKILQFGGQSYYKGTDILVKAIYDLKKKGYLNMSIKIVGSISNDYFIELKKIDNELLIDWKPYFLDEEHLYDEINNCDIVVLPYREISQSGVLLLSIFFERLIVCSDLPSFVETLKGEDPQPIVNEMLFKCDDYTSLSCLLQRYLDGKINIRNAYDHILKLKALYSWDNAAKQTLSVYNKITT